MTAADVLAAALLLGVWVWTFWGMSAADIGRAIIVGAAVTAVCWIVRELGEIRQRLDWMERHQMGGK